MRVIYHLEGLDCASCAGKIEVAASQLEYVEEARVDFSSSRIFLEVNGTDQALLKDTLQEIVTSLEPGVIVSEQKPVQEKLQLYTPRNLAFAGGILSFIVALFVPQGLGRNGLFIFAYFLAGYEVIFQAIRNIKKGQVFDEHFLMTIATLGALAIKEFPEAASVMIFYRTGEFLQGLAVDHSRRSISALIAIRPEKAHRKQGDTIIDVAVEEVKIGDVLVVYPGERIPVDGIILDGFSSLDTSALTGESIPQTVQGGEEVLSGCINLNGLLTIKAQKLAEDSAVARILDLVENATAHKAPTEDFITSFAQYYTPIVVGIAVVIASIPPLFFSGSFSDWFYRALVFLVISCPCALVVSIPLGFFGGIGSASRHGVLVKGSNYLQALHEADTVVFDKTGTLTSGQFTVHKVEAVSPHSPRTVLQAAAYTESFSSHPIARSIVQAYGNNVEQTEVQDVEELAGFGIRAKWQGKVILVGSKLLLEQEGVSVDNSTPAGVYVAIDGAHAGTIILTDQPKKGAARAVKSLQDMGKEVIMLTGDNSEVAQQVGEQLGINHIGSELLPHHKVNELEQIIKEAKGKVVFVGDGINDAPALARAHVGVAMGALGSDAAIETADVVLMTDDPYSIVNAMHIARRTNRIVWQNISLAFGVKLVVLALGAFGLATLWEAVFADVGVTILAVLNSLRIITPQRPNSRRIL